MNLAQTLWRRPSSLSPYLVDGGIAGGFFVFALLIHSGDPGAEEGFRDPDLWSPLLLGAQTLPLTLRRRAPVPVFLAMFFGGVLVHTALGYPDNGAGKLATLVAFFTVIERTDFRMSLMISAAAGVGLILYYESTRNPVENAWEEMIDAVVAFAGAWLIGTFVRVRREQSDRDAEHVEQLERERDSMTQLAIEQERTAIARELHDAVGHALNLIVIQASASRRVFASQPERSAEGLSAIESASRQALTDMDRMLGLLREDGRNGKDGQTSPGVADLDALIRRTEEAGLPVEKTVTGDPVPLPQTVDQSAYRIVQEALTNCLKHAGPAHAKVSVSYLDRAIELTITDDGLGSRRSNGSGRGLIGMRERVRLFGGDFEAGGLPEGGFRVSAKIPFGTVKA